MPGRGRRGHNHNQNQNHNPNHNSNHNQNQNQNHNHTHNHNQRSNHNQNNNNNRYNNQNLTKIYVRGWTNSTAATNPGNGLSDLHSFLEKKSQRRIQNQWREQDAYVILVNPDDADRFTHLNNFSFAGAPITVEQAFVNHPPINEPRTHQTNPETSRNNRSRRSDDPMQLEEDTTGVDQVEAALIKAIRRCYHPGEKHLNLTDIFKASEICEIGLNNQPASKVWAAIFVCCETKVFETPLKRQQMVESLTLSRNELKSVKDCISAAGTFNHIKNLDLSYNLVADVGELRYWRNRFPNLEHLILEGNPVDVDKKQNVKEKMLRWYPKLKMYNRAPVQVVPGDHPSEPTPFMGTVEMLPNDHHPECGAGTQWGPMFGQPQVGKLGDQVMKEQMGLRFSYETRLKLEYTSQILMQHLFDYDVALARFKDAEKKGEVPEAYYWTPRHV